MNQRDFRKLHGLTQEQFALLVGVHIQTVVRYENDGRIPRLDIMQRIVERSNGEIDVESYYDRKKPRSKGRRITQVAAALVVLLSASPALGASYQELIFCARWYAGVHAALQASGLDDDGDARAAQTEARMFGYRALAATPASEVSNARKVVAASNNAVHSILANGSQADWERIHQACGGLK